MANRKRQVTIWEVAYIINSIFLINLGPDDTSSHTRPHSANHSQVYVTQHLLAPDAVFWILYIDLFPRNLTK